VSGRSTQMAWIISILVIIASWTVFFGVVALVVPRSQWIGIALEILVVSGILLLIVNARIRPLGAHGPAYRFVAVWGISLPLLLTYLSSLAERDVSVLVINTILVVFVLAWANWTLAVLGSREKYSTTSLVGLGLVAAGTIVLVASWGWLTLSDWPMMPYTSYMLSRPLPYFGLLLIAAGIVLWIVESDLSYLSRAAWRAIWSLVDHFKELVLLVCVLWLVVAVLMVYLLVRVPFPKEISRTDASGQGMGHLISRVEKLDIGEMLGRQPFEGPFEGRVEPWFVDGYVLHYFLKRSWWFKLHVRDIPGFRENGWLRYTAKVEFFNGVVERKGSNVTVRSTGGGPLSLSRAPKTYWYNGGETSQIADGFVVTMTLDYMEIYANLGAQGFLVGPQYAFFDNEEQLIAILTPETVRMRMA